MTGLAGALAPAGGEVRSAALKLLVCLAVLAHGLPGGESRLRSGDVRGRP